MSSRTTNLDLGPLKVAIERGAASLFLGAGASSGCLAGDKQPIPMGSALAESLASDAGLPFQGEDLEVVHSAVRDVVGEPELHRLMRQYLTCGTPSQAYEILASVPWARIYTTNIDDSFEVVAQRSYVQGRQRIRVQSRKGHLVDRDQTYENVDLVKLHGSIDRLHEGIVFGDTEYAAEGANPSVWYSQIGLDYLRYNFIFIGSSLREPVIRQQIERARYAGMDVGSPRAFLVVPSLTQIEESAFSSENIVHIPWTIDEFAHWVERIFPSGLDYLTVAGNNNPTLKRLLRGSRAEQEKRAGLLETVEQIGIRPVEQVHAGTIRRFYRGFKPVWSDIENSIPATIESVSRLLDSTKAALASNKRCVVVRGPAGSGKSTAARMVSYELAKEGTAAFWVQGTDANMVGIIEELERANDSPFLIICDRLEHCADAVVRAIQGGKARRATFLGVESQHVWMSRVKGKFRNIAVTEHHVDRISQGDVNRILAKLERWGPWTRLAGMRESQRRRVLFDSSRRQLLIGLLEATQGMGFEQIIQRDFQNLSGDAHRKLLVVVGLASIHRLPLPITFAARAMRELGYDINPWTLVSEMDGVIHGQRRQLVARHPTYVRSLIESNVTTNDLANAVQALLTVFTAYQAPVVRSVSRREFDLFRRTVNSRFLREILRDSVDDVLRIYRRFEKPFERDGLFWLQYGLALRHFDRQKEAFEKIRMALEAHPQPHTRHAFAQQQFIMALQEPSALGVPGLVEEAIGTLENLDRDTSADDYPITTLARGHTAFVRATAGDAQGRVLAKQYADRIQSTLRRSEDSALRDTWTWLTSYAIGGRWNRPNLTKGAIS